LIASLALVEGGKGPKVSAREIPHHVAGEVGQFVCVHAFPHKFGFGGWLLGLQCLACLALL
jgi:hypothetical protein